jgi:hypothetical protein
MKRRTLLKQVGGLYAGGLVTSAAQAATQNANEQAKPEERDWHDVREWGVEGKAWADTEDFYDRLPARAKATARPVVWDLSRHSAGMCFRFKTNATDISARWTLRSTNLAMPHMSATGVSGLDLYAEDDKGHLRWAGSGSPKTAPDVELNLVTGMKPGTRVYCIYLPLYNGVKSIAIGLPKGASFEPVAPRQDRPLLFYGTSILHGACASRPGMAHASILGRRLKTPIINLGFSGNGRMEQAISDLIAELNPCAYIIDCLPNMSTEMVAERTEPLVQTLRRAHPETPIVLVEDRTHASTWIIHNRSEGNRVRRAALRQAFDRLKKAGDKNLHYVRGDNLLGHDDEATVDGSHPNDVGFMRYADVLEPVLKPFCKK